MPTTQNPNNNQQHHPPQVDMLIRFLRLHPPTFSSSQEPIVADDWLPSINKNLVTINCTEEEKVRFTAHLLEGPTAPWWENYQITTLIEHVTWDMFQETFRTAHISARVLNLKKSFCGSDKEAALWSSLSTNSTVSPAMHRTR